MSKSRELKRRFLRGGQIAFLINEYFRLIGSYDEIQGLSGLFSIKLENDDIQDFGRQMVLVQKETLVVFFGKPRDIGGRSEEHRSIWPQTSRE